MVDKLIKIKNLLASEFVVYLFYRYFAYGIQFLNSIILLNYLGSTNYGIYGFGLMLISYISYTNLGLNQSISTILAIKKSKKEICYKIWNTSFTINLLISFIILLVNTLILSIDNNFALKYNYNKYSYYIIIIGIFTNTNLLFISLYRIYGIFYKININQLLVPGFVILSALFFKHHLSLEFLFSSIILGHLISFILFYYNSPKKTNFSFSFKLAKIIINRGINLMVYNLSFQLIILTGTTIISIFYTAEQLGYFSLSVAISSAVVMLIGSTMFMIYPKLLNKLSNNNINLIKDTLEKIQYLYVLCVDLLTISALIIIPIFELYFPKYEPINESLKILLITQLILNSTNGFSILLIARKEEAKMTMFGFISVLFVFLTSFLFKFIGGSFSSISIAILLGIIIYSILILIEGLKRINQNISIKKLIEIITPIKIIITAMIITSFLISDNLYLPITAVFLFYIFSFKKIMSLKTYILFTIQDNNILKF